MADKKVLVGDIVSGSIPVHGEWNTGDSAVDPDNDILLTDAPADTKQYVRKDAVWTELQALSLDQYGSLILEQELPFTVTETRGPAVLQWNDITVSESGQYVTASGWDRLYTSSDYGVTFTPRGVSGNTWRGVSMSGDGQYQLAAFMGLNGKVYRSSNYGVSWSAITVPDKMWIDNAVSYDGQYQLAVTYHFSMRPGVVYISNDYGVTWSEIVALAGVTYGQADMSATGQYMIISDASGNVKLSNDYGATWSTVFTALAGYVQGLDMSMDGQHITVGVDAGSLWVSHDYGVTWTEKPFTNQWFAIALSYSGQIQLAVSASSSRDVLFSTNYGDNWTELTDATLTSSEYTSVAMNGDGKMMVIGLWVTGTQARLKISRDFLAGDCSVGGLSYGEVAYTPNNSAHWAGNPTTIKQAIDRLAAAMYVHQGNVPVA